MNLSNLTVKNDVIDNSLTDEELICLVPDMPLDVHDDYKEEESFEEEVIEEPSIIINRADEDKYTEVQVSSLTQLFISIENLATDIMRINEVGNVSLSSFGSYSNIFKPKVLNLLTFGVHKFIGLPYNTVDQTRIFYLINEHFEKNPKMNEIVIKLTNKFVHAGITYYSLIATEEILQMYSDIFQREVLINEDEIDIDNLCAVIKRNKKEL